MIRSVLIFFILLTTLASCYLGNRSDEGEEYDPNLYERVDIDYHIYGKADTSLVFIHGWNIDQKYWDSQVKEFSNQYRVVTLDLAGHGKSSSARTSWTAESFARDIVNILKKDTLTNVVLIGHSMAGEIALQIYNQAPERIVGIIGVDNFKDVDFSITPEFRKDFKEYLNKFKLDYEKMADQFVRENIRSTKREVINQLVKDYKKADPKIALTIFKNMVPKYEEDKINLGKLKFPLYIIASDYEPYNEKALRKYAAHGYEIRWIHDAGHFPMYEQPQQFNFALKETLKDIHGHTHH